MPLRFIKRSIFLVCISGCPAALWDEISPYRSPLMKLGYSVFSHVKPMSLNEEKPLNMPVTLVSTGSTIENPSLQIVDPV